MIDDGPKTKIERGEFVDLEKLIAKDNGSELLSEENRVELKAKEVPHTLLSYTTKMWKSKVYVSGNKHSYSMLPYIPEQIHKEHLKYGNMSMLLSIEWNLIRLGGSTQRIVTKLYTKLY